MDNYKFLKKASLEIYAVDNDDIVKVANILKRFKNWFKKQFDSEYAEKVDALKEKSSEISTELTDLAKSLKSLDKSIQDSDVEGYQVALDDVKNFSLDLSKKLNHLGIAANKAKIKTNYTNREEFLVDPERPAFDSAYDVPTEEGAINKPVQSFVHFQQFAPENISINTVVFDNIVAKVSASVSRPGVSDKELLALAEGGTTGPFAMALKGAILNGKLVSNKLATPSKKIKNRPANQMDVQIITAPFDVPNTGLNVQMLVGLVDLFASHVSRKIMSIKYIGYVTAVRKNKIANRIELFSKFALSDTSSLLKVPGIEKTSPAFKTKLIQVANRLGMNPDHLATVISFETGGTFNPSIKNRAGSGAVGLIQFMPPTALNLGTTTKDLANMSAEQQLDYVEKYFAGHKNLKTLNDIYLAVLYPAASGKAGDNIVFQALSKAYEQNKGFDKDNKGYVTNNDITNSIHGSYNAAKGERLAVEAPAVENGDNMPQDNEYGSLMRQLLACGPVEQIVRNAVVKKLLPTNKFIISMDNSSSNIKFADISCCALRNDLNAKVILSGNNDKIEIECSIIGSYNVAKEAVSELISGINNAFKLSTGENAKYNFIKNSSNLPLIKAETIVMNNRLFKLGKV